MARLDCGLDVENLLLNIFDSSNPAVDRMIELICKKILYHFISIDAQRDANGEIVALSFVYNTENGAPFIIEVPFKSNKIG